MWRWDRKRRPLKEKQDCKFFNLMKTNIVNERKVIDEIISNDKFLDFNIMSKLSK